MTRIIDEAIAAGKFPQSRRAHYERLYALDARSTTRLIASLYAVPTLNASAPERVVLAGGFYDSARSALEFQDTEVTKDGVRPALGSFPRPLPDPAAAEPLPGFEPRTGRRITFAE